MKRLGAIVSSCIGSHVTLLGPYERSRKVGAEVTEISRIDALVSLCFDRNKLLGSWMIRKRKFLYVLTDLVISRSEAMLINLNSKDIEKICIVFHSRYLFILIQYLW